jgi:CubicO group peptidase (beta-lactamase class C family)
MTEKSLQRCYSITKPITNFGLLALWEDGKLRLDDPVAKYIPEFAHMKVLKKAKLFCRTRGARDAKRLITLRHLVTHTSGLGYGPARNDRKQSMPRIRCPVQRQYLDFVRRVDSGEIPNLEVYCQELAKQPLQFEPGERYEYSFSMEVIGRVLEVVSGLPLDRFMKQRVLEPIGMCDTAFFLTPRKARKQLAGLYMARKDAKKQFHRVRLDGKKPEHSGWVLGQTARIFSGGGYAGSCDGGLVSSLRDVALFCNTIACGGFSHATKTQVLKPSTIQLGCRNWLRLRSVTRHYPTLKGWSDSDKSFKKKGWAPVGITEGDEIFMGGIAYWCVNRRSKKVIVSFPNTFWDNFSTVPGWKAEVDEIDEATRKAEQVFREQKCRKRVRSDDKLLAGKRCKTA